MCPSGEFDSTFLGLLYGDTLTLVRHQINFAHFDSLYFPGLPMALRYTPAVARALAFAMNLGHENYYCQGSEHVNVKRVLCHIPDFDDIIIPPFKPYWYQITGLADVYTFFLPHMVENILSPSQV